MSSSIFHGDSNIEVFREGLNFGTISHAVFDHDGTISTLRQGWEEIMFPVMMKAIVGEGKHTLSEEEYTAIENRVTEFIDESTGIQTILQMESLVELVKEFGMIHESHILDPQGYKKIYNDELMVGINERIEKIKSNESPIDDWLITGVKEVLQALHDKGVKLYLASGTDVGDVIIEAELMGYADLFEGRIYGSVGDIKKYSKKKVLKEIMTEHNLKGDELITFGDGPVEIRETRKLDGITVGIASNEGEGGLCPEKRNRLINAGADLIIPDFSQIDTLMMYLFPAE